MEIIKESKKIAENAIRNKQKYGTMRINIKNLLSRSSELRENIKNRKSEFKLEKLENLYKKFVNQRYEIDSLIMKRREHEQ